MPVLPSINIANQSHYDRIVAAFPGSTPAEKVQAYRNFVVNHLITFVEEQESEQVDRDLIIERQRRLKALQESLPERPPMPAATVIPSAPDPAAVAAASVQPT